MCEDEKIDWLVDNGFLIDLLQMIRGENEYSDLDSFNSMDKHSTKLRTMVLKHLEFVHQFGRDTGEMFADGKFLSAYPEYFKAWKLAGCLGIAFTQLGRLIDAKKGTIAES